MPKKLTNADFAEAAADIGKMLEQAGYTPEDIQQIISLCDLNRTGERPSGKKGRDSRWSADLHLRLIKEVGEITGGQGSRKVSEACRILAAREPWKSFVEATSPSRNPADVLRERYVRLFKGALEIWTDDPSGQMSGNIEVRVGPKQPKTGRR